MRQPQLLPPELPWLYAFVPLPAAYLMCQDVFAMPLGEVLAGLGSMYLPFLVFGTGFHFVYRHLVPSALRGLTRRWQRIGLHAFTIAGVTLVLGCAQQLLGHVVMGRPTELPSFLLVSLIFSCACIVPALVVQRLRVRAQAAEHLALVERKATLEAQLQALQARTDPHFLFNSLNTVAALIHEDPALAERTLERLADLFRYALESSRVRTVRLERELAMVADYLALQSARFGQRLQTRLDIESGLGGVELPPLLLQPLVENAIVHGTAHRRGGRVEVAVRRELDHLIVEVRDDGPGPGGSSHLGAGTAVAGVTERLRLFYAERATLRLQASPLGGCLAQLALPLDGVV